MIEEYDRVELLVDMGKIKTGTLGVVVFHSADIPDLFAVEFCDEYGRTIEILDVRQENLRISKKTVPHSSFRD
ncbi:MAG: DUF4926 domain-containing protein [Alphaproteobacteria bacterium]|nr:DUF4926 domain-containing protein [Alphaproteobacteria bacterium]